MYFLFHVSHCIFLTKILKNPQVYTILFRVLKTLNNFDLLTIRKEEIIEKKVDNLFFLANNMNYHLKFFLLNND